jgi:hypothetical protein
MTSSPPSTSAGQPKARGGAATGYRRGSSPLARDRGRVYRERGRASLVRVVYNGVDTLPRQPVHAARTPLRDQLGIGDARSSGCSAACPLEGAARAARALPGFPASTPCGRRRLFGEAAYAQTLREQARTPGVEDAFTFLGFRRDVPELMGCPTSLRTPRPPPNPLAGDHRGDGPVNRDRHARGAIRRSSKTG